MSDYYKERWLRNQMEEGLWHYLCSVPNWGSQEKVPELPKVFQSRIKKLLNLDRSNQYVENTWTFYDSASKGTGSQEMYSDYHVFNMALALNMLNIGFKQSEIIFFLQHIQHALRHNYKVIRHPNNIAPICYARDIGIEKATPYYLLINRLELSEFWPDSSKDIPIISEPIFVKGIEGLKTKLSKSINSYTAFAVLELADAAIALPSFLLNVPPAKRGRPA